MIKVGTRVINNYILSPHCGQHGVVAKFKSGVSGWDKIWSYIKYDDGTDGTEMNKYLSKEKSSP